MYAGHFETDSFSRYNHSRIYLFSFCYIYGKPSYLFVLELYQRSDIVANGLGRAWYILQLQSDYEEDAIKKEAQPDIITEGS